MPAQAQSKPPTAPKPPSPGEAALHAAIRRLFRNPGDIPLRVRLWRALTERLSVEDLRTFCFLLDLDFDILAGDGKSAKARELVTYFDRRDRLDALERALTRFRPDINPHDPY